MSLYLNLKKGLSSKPTLITSNTNINKIISEERSDDWYQSVFYYNDEHKKQLENSGTLRGIQDVYTDRVFLDFDSQNNLDLARKDVVKALDFLKVKGLNEKALKTYFSGNKGFSIEFKIDRNITVTEYKNLIHHIVSKFLTADSKVCDPQRVFRIENTLNKKSRLYKIPLEHEEIKNLSIDEIKSLAKNPRILLKKTVITSLPEELTKGLETKNEVSNPIMMKDISSLDFSIKPQNLSNCRWAMLNGFFEEGERNFALLCLAATWKNQGMPLEVTYRMLKGTAELQSRRTDTERFSDEEIYNNIVNQVYSPFWRGGQFSCQDETSPLHKYCIKTLGDKACTHEPIEDFFVGGDKIAGFFDQYVNNYEKNALKTGIESLDEKCNLMVGTSNGFVGPPSCGKTSLALQILNYNSLQDINSIFFSFDMFHSLLYTRMLQRHTGLSMKELYSRFRDDRNFKNQCLSIINEQYANVNFCFKNGLTVDDLDNAIKRQEDKTGDKTKLVMVDYNELLLSKYSDSTAASAEVAQKLRQLANERQVCVVTLLQPSKFMSNPSEPITSFNAAKGSGAIPQSVTLMLGFHRPGHNPQDMSQDKYFSITCLKNRVGPLFTVDLGWNGLRGSFSELDDSQKLELKQLIQLKEEEKKGGFGV